MLVFTGHSLGRVKKARLLEKGQSEDKLERRYKITRRIRAEEGVLQAADMIVASTDQEVEEQYGMYTTDVTKRAVVVHPGVNLGRFRPSRTGDPVPQIAEEVDRFLSDPRKPMILALQRADDRKNLATLIRSYGASEELRRLANLVLMIGTRDDIRQAPAGKKRVLAEMLLLIDHYDLYGSVAYPKSHTPDDVAPLYRLAAKRRGVFVNPALTEPFGLTLIEAAASGLPIVATNDGGPKAIISLCKNGMLVDPLDPAAIADALTEILSDRKQWLRMSRAGVAGADRFFSWKGHVDRYLRNVRRVQRKRSSRRRNGRLRDAMITADRMLVTDIDNTLLGDEKGLRTLLETLDNAPGNTVLAVATGRVMKSAHSVLEEWSVPQPDVLITAVGSEIHYGPNHPVEDAGWRRAIAHHWEPDSLRQTLEDLPGLRLQPKGVQRQFKLSYYVDTRRAPSIKELRALLKARGLKARVIFSHDRFLDLLPYRAGKGAAVSYLVERWGLGFDQVLVAGDSGNDTSMFQIGANGVVVGNHSPELKKLRDKSMTFFAEATNAHGIVEGMRHFGFLEEERP
jgi:sucrose-phosphate synthase